MSTGCATSLLSKWLDFVMHLTSAIAEKKQDIERGPALSTFFDVLVVVLLEGVLAIVSIPLYFITSRKTALSPDNEFNVQYSIRKTLTFGIFIVLMAVVVVKIFVLGQMMIAPQPQTGGAAGVSVPPEQIMRVLSAPTDQTIAPPTILSSAVAGQNGFFIRGTAKPASTVILDLSSGQSAQFLQMYTATADGRGNWEIPSTQLLTFPPGTYDLTARTFDPALQKTGPSSPAAQYTVSPTAQQSLISTLDLIANVLLCSFIAIGFLVVFLTF